MSVIFKKNSQFLYSNIFLYASLQSVGNVEEYFAKHTKKLVVFILMPRLRNTGNFVRVYKKGKITEDRKLLASTNIFLYYILIYSSHLWLLLKYFKKDEEFYVIAGHPIAFFFSSIQKKIRNITFAYWIGDYFPGNFLPIKLYEIIKKFYHDRIPFTLYLSDNINRIMNNGECLKTYSRHTVMWGVKPKRIKRGYFTKNQMNILFVGVIKESQGLEFLFKFIKYNKKYMLNIIGLCDVALFYKFQKIIKSYQIGDKVFFPNKFYSDVELTKFARDCDLGVAFYDIDKSSPTFYTDPGKIKTYTELGLPIIMSNTSSIVEFIRKFKAGEIIDRNIKSVEEKIRQIKKNYETYQLGVEKFNKYFYYEDYYKKAFKFLEMS